MKSVDVSPSVDSTEYKLYHVSASGHGKPLEVQVTLDGKSVTMELDTEATVSLMPVSTFQKLWPDRPLQESTTRLCIYLLTGTPSSVGDGRS